MAYTNIGWKNGSSGGTPLNADNLNHIEAGLKEIESNLNQTSVNSITALEVAKTSQTSAFESAKKAEEYEKLAKAYADNAEAIVGIGIATTEKAGIVKASDTITVDLDGTMHSLAKGSTQITQAEYNALSEAEKNNGTLYDITDASDDVLTLAQVNEKLSWQTYTGTTLGYTWKSGHSLLALPHDKDIVAVVQNGTRAGGLMIHGIYRSEYGVDFVMVTDWGGEPINDTEVSVKYIEL